MYPVSYTHLYAKLDADLREAYNQFNESGSLSTADILFDGDIRAWKKPVSYTHLIEFLLVIAPSTT